MSLSLLLFPTPSLFPPTSIINHNWFRVVVDLKVVVTRLSPLTVVVSTKDISQYYSIEMVQTLRITLNFANRNKLVKFSVGFVSNRR